MQVAREHKGAPIRLVVTDVIMPLMGGKVMAEWLKTFDPQIKILFTSGYTDDAIAHHGVLENGVEFLSKPYTPPRWSAKCARCWITAVPRPLHRNEPRPNQTLPPCADAFPWPANQSPSRESAEIGCNSPSSLENRPHAATPSITS